ncbi:MAG TPA: glycosyltransferase [Methylophilus sp.]|nr:glycosyltransferase [Methylophilus sp.]HQQ34005.1 glycosyltransferase [Methylophilus sp.]
MHIAYFINQYPKVSHSFIRREILALEKQGFTVTRIALRGWAENVVDKEDILEKSKTHYVLKNGLTGLLRSLIVSLKSPQPFLEAFIWAMRLSWRSDRPFPYHLIYLAEACQVSHWLKDKQVKHIHAHFGTNSAEVAMLASILNGVPYSFTVHGPEEFDKPQALKLKTKIEKAKFVVAISQFGKSQLYRWASFKDWPKIKVVHCGLEQSFFEHESKPIPSESRLLCIGRLCEQKGQMLLIEAAKQLVERGVNFKLILAGDGEMRVEIEMLISEYGLESNVDITGWISSDEVKRQLEMAQIMVLPSFAEGLPVVIMEAMALKRPVISTYVAGIPELVMEGDTGWLCPAGDVKALVNTLEKAIGTPRDSLQEMGDRGYWRVLESHHIDREAHLLAEYFQS